MNRVVLSGWTRQVIRQIERSQTPRNLGDDEDAPAATLHAGPVAKEDIFNMNATTQKRKTPTTKASAQRTSPEVAKTVDQSKKFIGVTPTRGEEPRTPTLRSLLAV